MNRRKGPSALEPVLAPLAASTVGRTPSRAKLVDGGATPPADGMLGVAEFGGAEPSRLISMRVPVPMLDALRRHAKRRAMPYQSLLKHWLSERLEEEGERLARHQAALIEGRAPVR